MKPKRRTNGEGGLAEVDRRRLAAAWRQRHEDGGARVKSTVWQLIETYDRPEGAKWNALSDKGDQAQWLHVADFSARLDRWAAVEKALRRLGALS